MKLFLLIVFQCFALAGYSQIKVEKVRLAKKTSKANDGYAVTDYQYDAAGRIKEIKYSENKKPHSTHGNFVFDGAGRLVSYTTTFSFDRAPLETKIGYDRAGNVERIERINTQKKIVGRLFKSRRYERRVDLIIEKPTEYFDPKISTWYEYKLNDAGNVIEYRTITGTKDTTYMRFSQYDEIPNPESLTGGFIDADHYPVSRNNYTEFDFLSRQISVIHTYQKQVKTDRGNRPLFDGDGLVTKSVSTYYNAAWNKNALVSSESYTYIVIP